MTDMKLDKKGFGRRTSQIGNTFKLIFAQEKIQQGF